MLGYIDINDEEYYDYIIPVDPEHLALVEDFSCEDINVRTALISMNSNMLGNGLEVSVVTFSDKKSMSEPLKYYIEREVAPLLDTFLVDVINWGFSVYIKTPSRELIGFSKPSRPPLISWQLIMTYRNNVREYHVVDRDLYRNTGSIRQSIMRNAYLSMVFPPRDDGRLNSPMEVLMPHVTRYSKFWKQIDKVSDALSNPKPIIEVDNGKSQGNSTDAALMTKFAENDLISIEEEYDMKIDETQVRRLEKASELVDYFNKGYHVSYDPRIQRHVAIMENNPINGAFVLPRGQKISRPNLPSTLGQIDKVMDMIMSKVALLLGASQSSSSSGGGASHAANTELELRFINDRIKAFQNKLIPEIEKMFENIWKRQINRSRKKIIYDLKKELNMENISLDKEIERRAKAIAVRIHVTFKIAPLTTVERLKFLSQEGIIADDTYMKLVAQSCGISENDVLSTEDRDSLLKKRKREEFQEQKKMSKLNGNTQPNVTNNNNNEDTEEEVDEDGEPPKKKKKKANSEDENAVNKNEKRRSDIIKKIS